MDKARKKLKKYFGHEKFYPFQEKVINEILKKKRYIRISQDKWWKEFMLSNPRINISRINNNYITSKIFNRRPS